MKKKVKHIIIPAYPGQVEYPELDNQEKPLEYPVIEDQIKFLQGQVLTIVDASYGDQIQRKAVKDLINGAFSQKLSWIYELCGYPKGGPHYLEADSGGKVNS